MYLIKQFKFMIKILTNPEVKFLDKLKIILMIIYILSPADLIPAPIFGFSIIDDIIIFIFLIRTLNKLLIKYNYKTEKETIKKENIIEDVEYEVKDKDKDKGDV